MQTRRTLRVDAVGTNSIRAIDVASGEAFGIDGETEAGSTFRVEMVRRVPRTKPKAGEQIPGKRFKQTMWKRGSIFRDQGGLVYTLTAEGTLRCANYGGYDVYHYKFDHFAENELIDVLWVA